jgi:hypothetical protein
MRQQLLDKRQQLCQLAQSIHMAGAEAADQTLQMLALKHDNCDTDAVKGPSQLCWVPAAGFWQKPAETSG